MLEDVPFRASIGLGKFYSVDKMLAVQPEFRSSVPTEKPVVA